MSELAPQIERLTAYDLEDARGIGLLMPLVSESFSAEPIPEEHLRNIIASPYHDQLVARLDERIVGAATLSLVMGAGAGKKGYLDDFVTDPEVRGKGIGSKLWDASMAWCDERGVDLHFTSRPSRTDAHAFYLSRGATIRKTNVFQVTTHPKPQTQTGNNENQNG